VRPRPYPGYGYWDDDDDAWKFLAFTAITLKILDNMNEQAQREHEAAQVKATTAAVTWDTGDASGHVVTTRTGTGSSGLQCREFQQEVTVGGQTEQAYGTACLQEDGSWKITE
jgi:surface antigen